MSSLNETPTGERVHIAFFGRRNVGKSSLVNAFTGQDMAIVSDVKGTTTDPVAKAMELLPLGPVLIIDTPGIDDEGELGMLRVRRTQQILNKTDLAIVVADGTQGLGQAEQELLNAIKSKDIPYLLVYSKADLLDAVPEDGFYVSSKTGFHVHELKQMAAGAIKQEASDRPLVADLLKQGDVVVLVVPIDKAAPKGRLILPQQQTIRDCLEAGALPMVCRDTELEQLLSKLTARPRMVITDSQIFDKVSRMVPEEVPLTSFSILMARYKGELMPCVNGAKAIEQLRTGDRVLIAEGCTHHRQCGDIGTQKLPAWICGHTAVAPQFEFVSGGAFPEDVSDYRMVIHCGGCMLSKREMRYRQQCCEDQGVPFTNYGVLIAYLNGILDRTIAPFSE